jgi:hypothetical protein
MKPRSFDRINRTVRMIAFALLMAGGLVAALGTPSTSQSTTSERVEIRRNAAKTWSLEQSKALQADESRVRSER